VLVAFSLAVLSASEGSAVAAQWVGQASGAGPLLGQRFGSAAGRSHEAGAASTGASAKGGHIGALTAPGELPLATSPKVRSVTSASSKPPTDSAKAVALPVAPEVKGFDARTSREVVGERGAERRVYKNNDGTYTTRFYSEPVNYQRPDGSWQAIDTTLVPVTGGGAVEQSAFSTGALGRSVLSAESGWTTESGELGVFLGAYGDDAPIASLTLDADHSVGFSLSGAAHVAGTADGSTITYPEVRTSSDVQFMAGSDSFKETLLLCVAGGDRAARPGRGRGPDG
jgi:hypothetical protein